MKIEKLPSGSYRIRKMNKVKSNAPRMSFCESANKYIDVKSNVLSPSTINGYRGILRNISEAFRDMNINDISAKEQNMKSRFFWQPLDCADLKSAL